MLSLEALQHHIHDLESDRIERTISTKDIEKFSKAICAFSNDMPDHRKPGYLIVGVEDDGEPKGLKVTDTILKDLASIRPSGAILPLPEMNVQEYTLPDGRGDVVVVEVNPSNMPPVRYKGRVWIRVGPTCQTASESEERILSERRVSHALTFDARPCLGSDLSELVQGLFLNTYLPNAVSPDIIEQNNREIKEQLASLRFYDLKEDCPTYAGILLFGQDPMRWIPGAYIQFVRFNGTAMSDPVVNEKRFSGDLITVLKNVTEFIPFQIQQYPEYENIFKERAVLDYPERAVRELLMNAIMHCKYEYSTTPIRCNWFSDRIEILNPGGLYGDVTPENYTHFTSYRNPEIAEAMKTLGYVNCFGAGMNIINADLLNNGNPQAEFTFEPSHVHVTVRRRS